MITPGRPRPTRLGAPATTPVQSHEPKLPDGPAKSMQSNVRPKLERNILVTSPTWPRGPPGQALLHLSMDGLLWEVVPTKSIPPSPVGPLNHLPARLSELRGNGQDQAHGLTCAQSLPQERIHCASANSRQEKNYRSDLLGNGGTSKVRGEPPTAWARGEGDGRGLKRPF